MPRLTTSRHGARRDACRLPGALVFGDNRGAAVQSDAHTLVFSSTGVGMTAQIIDGTAIAAKVRAQVAAQVQERAAAGKTRPGLATVLVGDNPASETYVRSKRKACAEVGIESFPFELPKTAAQREVDELVKQLNADPRVHGILVQLPLPEGLNEEQVL